MISNKIKNIISKSNIYGLKIDDENNTITSRYLKINILNENSGNVEFYLFGHKFNGKVFFNSLDSCYIELDETNKNNNNIKIQLKDILYNNTSIDFSILEFFHIKSFKILPITSIN